MPHVSFITLGVDDPDRASRFYETLGWRRSSASVAGTVAFLRGGATVLALFGRGDLASEAGLDLAARPGVPTALAMNLADPQAVDDVLAAVAAAGGRVTRSAERADWGGYSGYATDPDGHLWEIAHNPGFPLLVDGRIRLPDDDPEAPRFALHHVQLAMPAGGESRARTFYGDQLGLHEVTKPPELVARGGVWFRAGGLELHLGVEEPFAPARKAHPGIVTDDLDGLMTRLTAHGHQVRPDDRFPGYRRCDVDDVFGNRLEFLQPAT